MRADIWDRPFVFVASKRATSFEAIFQQADDASGAEVVPVDLNRPAGCEKASPRPPDEKTQTVIRATFWELHSSGGLYVSIHRSLCKRNTGGGPISLLRLLADHERIVNLSHPSGSTKKNSIWVRALILCAAVRSRPMEETIAQLTKSCACSLSRDYQT